MDQRIRIIKLAEREQQAEARIAKRRASRSHVAQEKARDAAWTITRWIGELREQKQLNFEAARAFQKSTP
jgi:hypothetical protein